MSVHGSFVLCWGKRTSQHFKAIFWLDGSSDANVIRMAGTSIFQQKDLS